MILIGYVISVDLHLDTIKIYVLSVTILLYLIIPIRYKDISLYNINKDILYYINIK